MGKERVGGELVGGSAKSRTGRVSRNLDGSRQPEITAEAMAGVPDGQNGRGRGSTGMDQRGGSGLMIPSPIPTAATPAPTAAVLCEQRAHIDPINYQKSGNASGWVAG